MSKIRILALPVDREPYITNIENSLGNMQRFVGGYIETVTVLKNPQVILICDEEGLLKGSAVNPSIPNLDEYGWWGMGFIVGDCFLCGVDGEEFADLPDEWKDVLLKRAKEAYREKHIERIESNKEAAYGTEGQKHYGGRNG